MWGWGDVGNVRCLLCRMEERKKEEGKKEDVYLLECYSFPHHSLLLCTDCSFESCFCVGGTFITFSIFFVFNMLCVFQPTTKLFINNEFVESKTNKWIDVHNPVSGQVFPLHLSPSFCLSACILLPVFLSVCLSVFMSLSLPLFL